MHTALRTAAATWQRLSRRAFLAASVATLAAACSGGDKSSGPSDRLNGTYNLVSVEDLDLPVQFTDGEGDEYVLDRGTLTINNGSTFTAQLRVNGQNVPESGSVRRNGDVLEFDGQDTEFSARLSNNNGTITADIDLFDDGETVSMEFRR